MAHEIFFTGKDNEKYKLSLNTNDQSVIDIVLDQFNFGEVKFIKEEDFIVQDKMTIDVEWDGLKIGELTCKNLYPKRRKKFKVSSH